MQPHLARPRLVAARPCGGDQSAEPPGDLGGVFLPHSRLAHALKGNRGSHVLNQTGF